MAAIVIEGAGKPLVEADLRRPSGQLTEAPVIGHEIADIDLLTLLQEFAPREFAAAIRPDQRLGKRQQRIRRLPAHIQRLPGGVSVQRGDQKRLDRIVDIQELAALLAAPDLESLPLQHTAQPDAEEVLP